MSTKILRTAVIGCGRIAGHHCRSVVGTNGVELAAVCDLDADKGKTYGDELGVSHYTNYHQMLTEHPDIDIVAVITPSGMHFEHAIDVMSRYGKHIIVEKPTFMRPSQVQAAYKLADEKGVQIFPVFQNRYNKAVRRVKRSLDEGEIGDIRVISVRLRWCRPQRYYDQAIWRGIFSHDGGALTNQGVHHVDLLRYLGGEVESVNATMRTLGAEIEVEDTIVATMKYPSGALGVLEVTTAARPDDFEASLSIVGSKGLVQIGGVAVNELQVFTPAPEECEANSVDFRNIEGRNDVYGHGHTDIYEYIVDYFNNGTPFPVDREDCHKSLKLLHAFYRADEAGDWVNVDGDEESVRLGRPDDAISDIYRTPTPEQN